MVSIIFTGLRRGSRGVECLCTLYVCVCVCRHSKTKKQDVTSSVRWNRAMMTVLVTRFI